jgi:hypothetical protein
MKLLTKKILNYKKQANLNLQSKIRYNNKTGDGFIYVLKVKTINNGSNKKCYKIGYTSDLNKRLKTYKTGHPDIDIVYQENIKINKKQLEQCVLNLNILKRITSKNEIICNNSLKEILNEIEDCKKLITKYAG